MRAYILTEDQARRVPFTLLIGLCLAYLIPGYGPRDPWGSMDTTGFGIALTFAQSGWSSWLAPSAFGVGLPDEAPLSYWLIAAGIRLTDPWLSAHTAARLTTGLLVAFGLLAMWRAALLFARRPEIQPSDPFGASAAPEVIARSMADAGVLITLACCGLIIRLHETTSEAIQFTWTALLLLGFALTLERPKRGGLIVGLALVATALGSSPLLALLFGLAWLVAHGISAPLRVLARDSIPASLAPVAATLALWLWVVALSDEAGRAAVLQWWRTAWPPFESVVTPWADQLRTLAWFVWPAWPLALWTLWKWRTSWREPALIGPALFCFAMLIYLSMLTRVNEQAMIPLALPLALLAIWALPRIARGFAGLFDWLAVALFSLFIVFIWAYWIALQTGFPPRMAASAARVAPGNEHEPVALTGLLAALATLAWLALIRWRLSDGPRVLWRPVVLSAAGLTITWLLLITLWLPVYDNRISLRAPVTAASEWIRDSAPDGKIESACVYAIDLGPAERTAFAYVGSVRFARGDETCAWAIRRIVSGSDAPGVAPPGQWERVWQGGRRIDRVERFTLERRVQ